LSLLFRFSDRRFSCISYLSRAWQIPRIYHSHWFHHVVKNTNDETHCTKWSSLHNFQTRSCNFAYVIRLGVDLLQIQTHCTNLINYRYHTALTERFYFVFR
jgi:hypothetical protein